MEYSLDHLKTVEDCDAALALLQKEEEVLNSKMSNGKLNVERHADISETSISELSGAQAVLGGLNTAIEAMPEGTARKKYEKEREGLEHKVKILEERTDQYGPVDLILKEVDFNKLESNLPVLTAAIAAVEAHKATL